MSEKREGTGQRRMRVAKHAFWLTYIRGEYFGSVDGIKDVCRRCDSWPNAVAKNVSYHAENLLELMGCDIARTLAESGPGEPKSAPIDEWRKSSDLGKPAEQLLRTLCAMGQMSRVKKRAKGSDSRRKVWHYGFFDALSFYNRVPRGEWPTRGGETVSADELQRYGGAWDVTERESVDDMDLALSFPSVLAEDVGSDPRTLAVGIACGRYVVNEDGTVSMAVSGWGATSRPVGELDGEPVAPTGETDADTGLPLLDTVHGCGTVADRADPDHARAAFAEMRGDAQYATEPDGVLPSEVHRFIVHVTDIEGIGRDRARRRINDVDHIDQVFQRVEGAGQTITVEWHDRHPLNLTDTDADAWFTAEHARQNGAPTDVDAMRTRIAELEAERDAMAQAYTRDRATWTESIADISGKRDAAVAARDAAVRSADSLQATLGNVAAILGADPTCNPDVEGWARSAMNALRRTAPIEHVDAWKDAMSAVALAITGSTPYNARTPDDVRDECIRAISSTPRQFTNGELRAIRAALAVGVDELLEEAGQWTDVDRIEMVAHHAAALARTIRALPTD